MRKDETGLLSHTRFHTKSKRVEDLNIRSEAMKLLEEKAGGKHLDWAVAFWRGLKSTGQKNRCNCIKSKTSDKTKIETCKELT